MGFSTVYEWTEWIASLHKKEMEFGLARVKTVAERLGVLSPACPVIIVGGTNGKGSTVAGLESIYRAGGYLTGIFTSPYLYKINEQIRVAGKEATDEDFYFAFAKVADALSDITLTHFEFMTLAALVIFNKHQLDVMILEVGLGGRLDAVNIIDADVAVITSIAIDHVEYLGDTREKIAHEKAGIFRRNKPAVCGDPLPPHTLTSDAENLGTHLFCQQKDFHYREEKDYWEWSSEKIKYQNLPLTNLAIQNMSSVLMAVTLMQPLLPITEPEIQYGLQNINLLGRIQVKSGAITEIFDVSHNPASIALLAKQLRLRATQGKKLAVFSMLGDKDIKESVKMIESEIDHWYVAPLADKRAASSETLMAALQGKEVTLFTTISEAYLHAKNSAQKNDCIIVFGSFHTVGEIPMDVS